jgi:hypothetical protein
MTLEFAIQISEKYSNIKFILNLSNGSRLVLCGQSNGLMYGRTDKTKLTVAFRNFANASKNAKGTALVEGTIYFIADTLFFFYFLILIKH